MGFDTHTVFILFGVKVLEEDIRDVLNIFHYPDLDEAQIRHPLYILDTPYRIINSSIF